MKLQPNTFFIVCLICSGLLASGCSWNNPYAAGTAFGGAASGFRLTAATSSGFISIELTFSQNLDPVDAEDTGNYSIPGLAINSAVLLAAGDTVRLITGQQADQQYTVTVSNVQNAANTLIISPPDNTADFNGIGYSGGEGSTPDITVPDDWGTIQQAIDNAAIGDVIYVRPGTYDERLIIDKRIILMGSGSGNNPAVDTIIESTTQTAGLDEYTVRIDTGGSSSAQRLVIKDLRVTGDIGTDGNKGTGIMIKTTDGHIKFENVASTGNQGNGIAFDITSSTTDIVLDYCYLSHNGNHGFRVPTSMPDITGLVIANSTFDGNTVAGVMLYTLGSSSDVTITDCVFAGNAVNSHTNAELLLYSFYGDATVVNITIISNGCESGIRLSGSSSLGTAGTVSFTNIYIRGTQQLAGTYPPAGLTITRYSNLNSVSFNNMDFKSTAPAGLFLGTITTNPVDIGSFIFDGTYTNDIELGRHGNSGGYAPTDVAVDATACTFVGALTDGDIEARVYHNPDDGNLGTVSWTTP
ncbi:MAG: hypothetical protein JW822_14360 [Spirochaetales bacterium]|nr:hypothetical protein [Spirochaetales bacterium]